MTIFKKNLKRLAALVLCAMLLLGALPINQLSMRASAASWADPYMRTMKQWGVMTQGRPSDQITRAEMAAVLKRAFGFTRSGPIPFTDVKRTDWFYDDIATAYTEGIFKGTSYSKASPNAPVSREQVLTFIGRCLRYEESRGEVSEFTDGKDFSNWSAQYVRSALLAGIINGNNGKFNPKSFATRGEVAKMLSIGMGNLVNAPGEAELGGVFGNVTVNTPNVTLRNTTIAGDLYLTGGVGLGNVILDNVTVLGKIIVAGGGTSESSEASILLNNVKAQQLVVDPATGQHVSLRAIGSTEIPETLIKSNAYIQDDVRNNSLGLQKVILDGPKGSVFTIAGNMKDVVDKTPGSTLTVGDTGPGSVTSITMGEEATGSHLKLEVNASVDKVNLDTATDITGTGDIAHLEVSTDGSSSEIMPDKITVRPGNTTQIQDIPNVDSEVAKELSSKPRLLAGYPKVKNVSPTGADAYFSTNKPGTIYWALTDAAAGPLDDYDVDKLIDPPDYGSGFKAFGSVEADVSKTEFMEKISSLQSGGTYFISAVLVDGHDWRSPVKAQKFTTPDDVVPALASNFPTIVDRTPTRTDANSDLAFSEIADIQATVMANKSCDLYYVLLAAGSTQPSTSEFLSSAFVDPYGYGKIPLLKNTLDVFNVTDVDLDLDGVAERKGEVEENATYDLYLWLTDANGEKSSSIVKKSLTTKDITPPEFMGEMVQTATQATSITINNSLNEDGVVYWAAVKSGADYPRPHSGVSPNDPTAWAAFLRSEQAKIIVANGINSFKSGKLNVKADTEFKINITGLEKENAYDIYYLAQDNAKNYSDPILMYTAHSLDSTAPTATQEFESYSEDNPDMPYAYSTIKVVFSEDIRYRQPSGSGEQPYTETALLTLYQNYVRARQENPDSSETAEALRLYTHALKDMIILYSGNNPAAERTAATPSDSDDWTVDYRKVQVYKDGSKLVVSFVNNTSNPAESALNLESGARYHFHLQNITDNSQAQNPMGAQDLPTFETVSSEVCIGIFRGRQELYAYELLTDDAGMPVGYDLDKPIYAYNDYKNHTEEEIKNPTTAIPIDISFTAEPRSTSTTSDGVAWDMLFWFDTSVKFELFTREHTNDASAPWTQVGGKGAVLDILVPSNSTDLRGVSVMQKLSGNPADYQFINQDYLLGGLHCGLNDKDHTVYDYALHFVEIDSNSDRSSFNQRVEGQVTFVSGSPNSLQNIFPSSAGAYNDVITNQNQITDITTPNKPGSLEEEPRLLWRQFTDGRAPQMQRGYPKLTPTSSGVSATFTMDRPGNVFYVIAPMTDVEEGTYAVMPQNVENNQNTPVDKDAMARIAKSGSSPTLTTDPSMMQKLFPVLFPEDTPEEELNKYRFSFPTSQTIVQPGGSGIDSNLLVYNSVYVTRADEPKLISGLAPDTEYLMYIVTQGVSDVLSPVTVYQFRTEKVSQPVITTQANKSSVTINSNLDATVNYKLISYDDNMNQILQDSFDSSSYTNDEYKRNNMSGQFSTIKRKPDGSFMNYGDPDFKVLDALLENVMKNGRSDGSFFDKYASQPLKDAVANYIDSTQSDNSSVGVGTGTIKANGNIAVECDKKWTLGEIDYCMIVYGYSGTGENASGKAFSAAQPVTVPKPKIRVSYQSSLEYEIDENNPTDKGKVNGRLTLYFTDDLHYYNRAVTPAKRVPLYAISMAGAPTMDKIPQSVESHVTCSDPTIKISTNPNNLNVPLRTMYIDFTDAPPRSNITFDGFYSGRVGEPQMQGLSIKVTPEDPKVSGNVNVTLSPADWIATN